MNDRFERERNEACVYFGVCSDRLSHHKGSDGSKWNRYIVFRAAFDVSCWFRKWYIYICMHKISSKPPHERWWWWWRKRNGPSMLSHRSNAIYYVIEHQIWFYIYGYWFGANVKMTKHDRFSSLDTITLHTTARFHFFTIGLSFATAYDVNMLIFSCWLWLSWNFYSDREQQRQNELWYTAEAVKKNESIKSKFDDDWV